MSKRKALVVFLIICMITGSLATGCNKEKEVSGDAEHVVRKLTNSSYSATREFYVAYNDLFSAYWEEKTGEEVVVEMTHGGSVLQSEAVAEKQSADIVTLGASKDVDALEEEKLLGSEWMKALENESIPYTSAVVFLVRKDSKKKIEDWDDLRKKGIEIMTPNPETSGGGAWNFFAAWAYAQQFSNGNTKNAIHFMKRLYNNVLIMYDDSRTATNNFVENGQGDVLITWESEAYLSMEAYPDDFEIITPSISILGQPVAAVVDSVTEKNETQEIAKEYLEYLYSEEGQRLAGEHFFRPVREEILQEFSAQFDLGMNLVTMKEFGGWEKAWKDCFGKNGIWEQVCPEEE